MESRFISNYMVFSRGYSKTYLEVLSQIVKAILYPNITISITSSTKESAASILKDKAEEIIRHYPYLENEIINQKYSKNQASLEFVNGARIDVLANAQTSKGQRRSRISVEEANLVQQDVLEDAVLPIVEVPRITNGSLGISDPNEAHQQVNYFTTSGYRNSTAFNQISTMFDQMVQLQGVSILTSSWTIPCYAGRGSRKSVILQKKRDSNPVFFKMNYESGWVGASDGALVTQDEIMSIRTLKESEYKSDEVSEYYMGVDVARSGNRKNASTIVVVGKVIRKPNNRIQKIKVVNIFVVDSSMKFAQQAIEIKKIKNDFNAIMVAVDSNGVGAGLIDALAEESFDEDGNYLGCWNPFNNPDISPSSENSEDCLYDLKPQNANQESITSFIGTVQNKTLQLLEFKQESDYNSYDKMEDFLPFLQTNYLIDEISNLKLVETERTKKTTVERLTKSIPKDKFSALIYLVFYIMKYEDNSIQETSTEDQYYNYFNNMFGN
jgi:ribonucleoside-diphosphate reductase alpha chain